MRENEYAVFLTRAQPLHQGHIAIIEKMLREHNKVLLIIGSSDKSGGERNPFNIEERLNYVDKMKHYKEFGRYDSILGFPSKSITGNDYTDYPFRRLEVTTLADLSSEDKIPYDNETSKNKDFKSVNKERGTYLYYNIVNKLSGETKFDYYYCDSEDVIKEWFPKEIEERITFKLGERDERYSSTKVREALDKLDFNYLNEALPYLTTEDYYYMIGKYKSIKGE